MVDSPTISLPAVSNPSSTSNMDGNGMIGVSKAMVRAAAVGFLLCSGGCGERAPAGEAPASSEVDAAIDAYIARTMDWYGIPAFSAAVVRDGEVVYAASHGVVDVGTGEPVTNDHLYQLSSSAKLFSSTAFMTLVEKGAVDLDGTVGEYLPDVPAAWHHVTVRQILSHLSGLPDLVRCDGSAGEQAHVACTADLAEPGVAGERFEYNQTNYYLVQKILEREAGRSLPEYVTERIFQPLGITDARYEGSSARTFPGLVSSYYPDDKGGIEPREYDFPTYLYSAAGLNASLNALITWVTAVQAGEIVQPETLEEMWASPALNDGRTSTYGLGWDLRPHAPGHRSVGHEGGGLTTLRIFPGDSLAVIVLTSGYASRFTPDEVAVDIAGLVDPELVDPLAGMAARMREALQAGGADAAVAVFAGTEGKAEMSPRRLERAVNRMAYELIHFDRFADAVTLVRHAVTELPESWILHDTLGEAYLGAGDEQAAITHYRRSVELNPGNEGAVAMLDSLDVR